MRWYFSYPVLAAGLAFGTYMFFPGAHDVPRFSPDFDLTVVTKAQAAPHVVTAAEIEAAPRSRLAAFSPGIHLAAAISVTPEPPRASVLDYLARTLMPDGSVTVAADQPPAEPVTTSTWKSAVVRIDPPAAPATPTSNGPETTSRVQLARAIQQELQRVGCYLGEIDGVWGGGSKRAIATFMDRVNATLPMREPDVFILSLLQGQSEPVCGAACPQGQSLTGSGQCLPSTLMAQRGKAHGEITTASLAAPEDDASASPVAAEAWTTVVAETEAPLAARRPAPYGRMGIGGPRDGHEIVARDDILVPDRQQVRPAPVLEQTAALTPQDGIVAVPLTDGRAAELRTTSFDSSAVIAVPRSKSVKRSKSASRPSYRRASSYRHVQRLFEHPLGRM